MVAGQAPAFHKCPVKRLRDQGANRQAGVPGKKATIAIRPDCRGNGPTKRLRETIGLNDRCMLMFHAERFGSFCDNRCINKGRSRGLPRAATQTPQTLPEHSENGPRDLANLRPWHLVCTHSGGVATALSRRSWKSPIA